MVRFYERHFQLYSGALPFCGKARGASIAITCSWLRLSYATSMESLKEVVGRIARV